MQQQYSVMISSTVLDLPQHREAVHIACHRQNVSPRMMEHLGVADVTSVEASLKMVDESDIYLLVLGTRYGTILPGYTESITELEFNRALERNKACLAFLMDTSKHPVVPDDVDVGEKAAKLHQFRDRVQDRHKLTGWFHSADDLRGLVVDSLSKFKVPGTPPPIHPISAIARAPDAYVAHPYTCSRPAHSPDASASSTSSPTGFHVRIKRRCSPRIHWLLSAWVGWVRVR